jgi:hypothetical protein
LGDPPWGTHLGLLTLWDPPWENPIGFLALGAPTFGIPVGGPPLWDHHCGMHNCGTPLWGPSRVECNENPPRWSTMGATALVDLPVGSHLGNPSKTPLRGLTCKPSLWTSPFENRLGNPLGDPYWETPFWTPLGGIPLVDRKRGTTSEGLPLWDHPRGPPRRTPMADPPGGPTLVQTH